ncbi:MAG: hypothetical protein HQ567_11840 [Candidatus Nealsonbacteria bacterium]|nr:hypothetical protein [Candidatus Nealsonbacteria bacterium]
MPSFGPADRFPVTQWSLVARAGQDDPELRRKALGELLGRYVPALRAHLVYRKGVAEEKADDLVQEFVADKILEKDLISRADRSLGKLRTFLLTALDRFAANQFRDQQAQKRSPGKGRMVALDERADGLPLGQRPSEAFDVAWARSVIKEALRQMRTECETSDRMQLWGVFECRVVGPTLEGAPAVDYGTLVERFGFRSPTQASNALTTAKRMYARALRCAVGEYAQDEHEVEAEIAELKEILGRAGR